MYIYTGHTQLSYDDSRRPHIHCNQRGIYKLLGFKQVTRIQSM